MSQSIATIRTNVLQPAQDARAAVNEVRQSLSEAEVYLRGYLLSRDPRMWDALLAEHAGGMAAFNLLRIHTALLDPDLLLRVEALERGAVQAWQQQLALRDAPAPAAAMDYSEHGQLMAQADTLRTLIIGRLENSRDRIRVRERTGALIVAGLGVLALAAAVVVVLVAYRDRRAAVLEAELRASAFILAEATAVEEVLSRIARSAVSTVTDASSFVERIDDERQQVTVLAAAGDQALAPLTRMPYPGSLTETAIATGTPEPFDVASMSPRPSAAALAAACGACAGVVVPLVADQVALGALVVLRPGRRFDPGEIRQLRLFGVLAALALRKAVLLQHAIDQQQELERLSRMRERMVRGFSHDIKNPVGAASGHAALLQEGIAGELNPAQQEHVRRLRNSLQSALEMIDDVVELARAESGQLPIRSEPTDPIGLLRDVHREYEAAAAARGLQFTTDLPPELPIISTDERRTRQILGNLVSNALKYTPEGGRIVLTAAVRHGRRAGDPDEWLTLAVRDTGPGIPEKDRERLFQEFQRLETGGAAGAGLGLAISQRVARLLGGEIRVESEVGRGSTFTLWLPCEEQSGNPPEQR